MGFAINVTQIKIIFNNLRPACGEERVKMKECYRPKTEKQKLGYLVEECGEVMAAVGKTIRWGLESYNPELPYAERETNRQWILRELQDLKGAIKFVEDSLNK
jgi:NTP pyrophosphatase (non-canonical NTP hydrolase)